MAAQSVRKYRRDRRSADRGGLGKQRFVVGRVGKLPTVIQVYQMIHPTLLVFQSISVRQYGHTTSQ